MVWKLIACRQYNRKVSSSRTKYNFLIQVKPWENLGSTHKGWALDPYVIQEKSDTCSNSQHTGTNSQLLRTVDLGVRGLHSRGARAQPTRCTRCGSAGSRRAPPPAATAALPPSRARTPQARRGASGRSLHTHLLFLRGGCLGDFRGHTAPSADETPGKDAITRWPGLPGRRTASGPPAPSLRPCARAASARGNGCHLKTTQSAAKLGRARPPPPRRPFPAAPQPTLHRLSGSATPKHFLSSFKGRGWRLTSHPSAECFLGIVVCSRWSRLSTPLTLLVPRSSSSPGAVQPRGVCPGRPRGLCCFPTQVAPLGFI